MKRGDVPSLRPQSWKREIPQMSFITQVLLPKCNNLNQPFDPGDYSAFHARMIRKFGGWTRKGEAEGAWLSPSGQMYAEGHWVYEVGHARREAKFWQAEKERLKEEFNQEEIWMMQYEGRRI